MKKEGDSKAPSIQKMKFVPKKPPKKKPVVSKIEPKNIKEEPIDTDLLQLIKVAKNNTVGSVKRMQKKEEEAKVEQVSFGATTSYSTFGASGSFPRSSSSAVGKKEKVYEFPWDENSNYPVTLPLREDRGDPYILEKEEDVGTELEPAPKLGLTIESDNLQMMLFQLPGVLPWSKPETGESSSSGAKRGCKLNELPGGYLGKLLVYKSGKVKMKIGENFFDVYPGSECKFTQDVAVVNLKEKHCCVVGQLGKQRAIVTPDVESMLASTDAGNK
ncbi:hypothetical protein LUZ62_085391 [Rhynchospora pubera]|uniref:DNA-directed RNA polymerase III subunit RPC4 n=1 Tax=Rhynchospora pubera TaxID=906938 RepID=A0AAV8AS30_9POAL|nr:hypothetical protein LUZ62_001981 [Rhynchospora pubera]KAJ4750986.1 hypothetical protein LUZ62_085391 [Rhynchospora pubera]